MLIEAKNLVLRGRLDCSKAETWMFKRRLKCWSRDLVVEVNSWLWKKNTPILNIFLSIFEFGLITTGYDFEWKERLLFLKANVLIINITLKKKTWMLKIKLDFWQGFNAILKWNQSNCLQLSAITIRNRHCFLRGKLNLFQATPVIFIYRLIVSN